MIDHETIHDAHQRSAAESRARAVQLAATNVGLAAMHTARGGDPAPALAEAIRLLNIGSHSTRDAAHLTA